MTNPAADARATAQANWPGASVFSRGRKAITHQHPTDSARFASDYHIGPIHFGPSEDQEIDTDWEAGGIPDQPWLWKMVRNDFNSYAMPGTSDFDAGQIIRYVDPDSAEEITFQPQQVQWSNDLDQIEAVADPATISGTVIGDELFWPAAYGAGIDFVWQAQTGRMQKRIEIDALATIGPPAQFILDGGNAYLKVPFIFQKTSGLEIWIDGVEWDEKANNPLITANQVEFKSGSSTLFYMAQPWAASTNDNLEDTEHIEGELFFRKTGPNLFVEVRIPWSWLETVTYPIVIDPTVDYQVGASLDDAQEFSNSTVQTTSTDHNPDGADEHLGLRWTAVTIDDGATIDVVWVDLAVKNLNQDEPNVVIDSEDASAPFAFTTGTNDITNRTFTTVTVAWDDSNYGITGNWQFTNDITTPPELITIIQQLLASYDYSSGSSMVCRMEALGPTTRDLQVRTYDGDTTKAAKLHIQFTAPAGGAAPPPRLRPLRIHRGVR